MLLAKAKKKNLLNKEILLMKNLLKNQKMNKPQSTSLNR